jgi:hypothetical protein
MILLVPIRWLIFAIPSKLEDYFSTGNTLTELRWINFLNLPRLGLVD